MLTNVKSVNQQVYKEIRNNSILEEVKIMMINSGRSQKSLSTISDFTSSRVFNVPEEISELMEELSDSRDDKYSKE